MLLPNKCKWRIVPQLVALALTLIATSCRTSDELTNSPIVLKLSEVPQYDTLRMKVDHESNCAQFSLQGNRGDNAASLSQKFSQCTSVTFAKQAYEAYKKDPSLIGDRIQISTMGRLSTLDAAEGWCDKSTSPIILSDGARIIYRDTECVVIVRQGKFSHRLSVSSDSHVSSKPDIYDLIKLTELRISMINEMGK